MHRIQVTLQGGPHDGKTGEYTGPPTDVLYATSGQVAYFCDVPGSAFTLADRHLIYRKTRDEGLARVVYAYAGDTNDEEGAQ